MTVMSVLYKILAKGGFHIVEFTFFRCLSCFLVSTVWSLSQGLNPIKHFPRDRKYTVILRSLMGHTSFTSFNLAVPFVPLSLVMIIFNTSPFWIAIIAFCLLGEPIIGLEIIGIILCFGAVVAIALQTDEEPPNVGDSPFMIPAGIVIVICIIASLDNAI